jgi:methylmalonyl-CoA/ethylmalonyl-CoA epimerase
MSGLLGNNVITQIGILVHDVDKVSEAYAAFFGMEQPTSFWTEVYEQSRTEFEGNPTPARAKLAFYDMGSLQIELIQPDENPSTWRSYLNEHGEGPHHIAFGIKGMNEKIELLAQTGFPLQQRGEYTGGRYAYIDTFPQLKVIVELLEND